MQKQFSSTNPNFIAMMLIALLGLATSAGIQFPKAPDELAGDIVNTFTTGGYFSLIGILGISIVMPIWNYVRGKSYPTVREFFSKVNTITYIVIAVLALVGLFGIPVLYTNAGDIAIAIYSKDWAAAIGVIFTSVLQPLFRWLIDKRNSIQQESKNVTG